MDDVEYLVTVLEEAERQRAEDVDRLRLLGTRELSYFEHLGQLDDPDTDGLEGKCV